ncbi:MAG: NlpC/P60 family protein [Pseudoruegeria sp.]
MTDRRLFRSNGRVADACLRGTVMADRFEVGTLKQCALPVADLCSRPDGPRDKQIVFGQAFQVLESLEGWCFGYDPIDGYVGYLPQDVLIDPLTPTHRVSVRSGHVYSKADMKSAELISLPFGARLSATDGTGFLRLETGGFVAQQHVCSIETRSKDPALVAEMFLGTPYLWGGNTGFGIDCSGLVQLALQVCGVRSPRDSDHQFKEWPPLKDGVALRRGDLVFWEGHVGMMLDPVTLIHANAHHMQVAIEPLTQAKARIAAKEFGDMIGVARPLVD